MYLISKQAEGTPSQAVFQAPELHLYKESSTSKHVTPQGFEPAKGSYSFEDIPFGVSSISTQVPAANAAGGASNLGAHKEAVQLDSSHQRCFMRQDFAELAVADWTLNLNVFSLRIGLLVSGSGLMLRVSMVSQSGLTCHVVGARPKGTSCWPRFGRTFTNAKKVCRTL